MLADMITPISITKSNVLSMIASKDKAWSEPQASNLPTTYRVLMQA